MTLSPVALSTYARLNHLKQAVTALQKNTLAAQTELFVFSDAPKVGDEEKVQAVRDFLKTIDSFKRVEIVERKTNSRVFNNRQGMKMLLDAFGKMIFLEEDIVTAPTFLEYMNSMLAVYETDPEVLSITGFCPPIHIPEHYPYDIFFYPRFDPWGFGIWKDRFDLIASGISQSTIREIFKSPSNLYKFSRTGLDVVPAALNNYFGFKDNLDALAYTQQFSLRMFTVHPVRPLVKNIGLDGTGMHSKKKTWFQTEIYQGSFSHPSLPPTGELSPEIMSNFYRLRSGGWRGVWQIAWLATVILNILFRSRKSRLNI